MSESPKLFQKTIKRLLSTPPNPHDEKPKQKKKPAPKAKPPERREKKKPGG